MATDISKNTIFVLVTLTLLVSVLGMWTVLSQIPESTTIAPGYEREDTSAGTVSLKIQPPGTEPTDLATGQVVLKIQSPEE